MPSPKAEAFRRWLFGVSRAETVGGGPATPTPAGHGEGSPMPEHIGRYRVLRRIGQGGMGIVYEGRDLTLDRPLAIKTFTAPLGDENARRRLLREARAAASVSHPNVCQIHDIGEEGGRLFLVMELLEGESLEARLAPGPMPLGEATTVTLGILAALEGLHLRSVVHRDLKPSNVFLTPHGVKVLDFGLARPTAFGARRPEESEELTQSGVIVGTPRYMAPEQVRGDAVDERTDVFATGAILFEMLAGRPAFEGKSVVEVLYATLHEQPPALSGSAAVARVDRIARRALAKSPEERYPTAAAMAAELRNVPLDDSAVKAGTARPLKRLIVLPFRILRADPETDFLAFSLPDAITSSLAGFEGLVVRSTAAAARFAAEPLDLEALASDADVDLVMTGSLLRGGEGLQLTVQLTEVPAGTLVWSHTARATLRDVFAVQDDLARRILESLLAKKSAGKSASHGRADVPRSAAAYEFFLRANQLSLSFDHVVVARDLYLRCVEEDPDFAPAWARLGRCYRVIGKYLDRRPENQKKAVEALERALALNPDLSIAHTIYAHMEGDAGRAEDAMVRLLRRAQVRRSDPDLFVGLVHSCRYCGLFEASVAAHDEARRLDPHVPTSVVNTAWAMGDFERIVRDATPDDVDMRVVALVTLGRLDEARAALAHLSTSGEPENFQLMTRALRAIAEGRPFEDVDGFDRMGAEIDDPEGMFFAACMLSYFDRPDQAVHHLRRAVEGGYTPSATLREDRWLAAARGAPGFAEILARAEARTAAAAALFRDAGGEELLGVR